MNGQALERVFRSASGRIIAALAARFRDLSLAEESFSESCLRALRAWPERGVPDDPAAWLYRVAHRVAHDTLRAERTRQQNEGDSTVALACEPSPEEAMMDEDRIIPDERLRLMFICCHPAVAAEARAALALRLICGLTVTEIARAFLIEETALAQRLVRAKRKIADAGVPFELPTPEHWSERLEAVLSTLEVAYSKAHEDAAGAGAHAAFAAEVLHLTRLLIDLVPGTGDAYALGALVRYAEARRPARVDAEGTMIPLSQQDPKLWRRDLIDEADDLLARAMSLSPRSARALQAALQAVWCARRSTTDPAPWQEVLRLYDLLLAVRDDVFVRLNRLVALAEVVGPSAALSELRALDDGKLARYAPYQAVRAELLARCGFAREACDAYEAVLALEPPPAERRWLNERLAQLRDKIDD